MDRRYGRAKWGPDGTRAITSRSYWSQLGRWDREAREARERRRVFPSLCDPFEDRDDLIGPRDQFFSAMATTEHLIYLLLSKRPENIRRLWPKSFSPPDAPIWNGRIWLGTSVEDQQRADERIPALLEIPAAVRFLSVEPLLGPIDLREAGAFGIGGEACNRGLDHEAGRCNCLPPIDWLIVGGESGHSARPCDLAWIRAIRDQCKAAGVPVFVKQLGACPYGIREEWHDPADIEMNGRIAFRDPKGGDWDEWPEDLRIREFPRVPAAVARRARRA